MLKGLIPILSARSLRIIGGLICITFGSSEADSSSIIFESVFSSSFSMSLEIGGKIPPTLLVSTPVSLFLFFLASLFSCSSKRDRASLLGDFNSSFSGFSSEEIPSSFLSDSSGFEFFGIKFILFFHRADSGIIHRTLYYPLTPWEHRFPRCHCFGQLNLQVLQTHRLKKIVLERPHISFQLFRYLPLKYRLHH